MTMMSDFPWPVIFISVSGFGFIDPILSSSYFPLDWSATQLENNEARKKYGNIRITISKYLYKYLYFGNQRSKFTYHDQNYGKPCERTALKPFKFR